MTSWVELSGRCAELTGGVPGGLPAGVFDLDDDFDDDTRVLDADDRVLRRETGANEGGYSGRSVFAFSRADDGIANSAGGG